MQMLITVGLFVRKAIKFRSSSVPRGSEMRPNRLTWDFLITWLASSWMENLTPSSEEKEPMGDRVPDVSTMVFTEPLKSEKAWEIQTGCVYATIKILTIKE